MKIAQDHQGPTEPSSPHITYATSWRDTGASISISGETFQIIHNAKLNLELRATMVKLKLHAGGPIVVCGTTMVPVQHSGQVVTLLLVVIARNGPNLLVRDWFLALCLHWQTIFLVG